MENGLIKVEIKNGQQLVSGRELHKFLEIGTEFKIWVSRLIDKYNFIENKDFTRVYQKCNTLGGEQEMVDYLFILSVAKEISMVANTEKGKQARQYFIKVEEAWNNEDMILARALEIQNKKIKSLENRIAEDRPKVEFYNDVADSKNTCDMQTVAKLLNFKNIGRNTLFEILRNESILQPDNKPYQKYVDKGWFRLIETKYNDKNGDVKVNFKTVVFQRGIEKISALLKRLGYSKEI